MARFTEEQLPKGIAIRYQHFRHRNGRLYRTDCYLEDKETRCRVAAGSAHVSEREPNPCKKVGRDIARGRAIKQFVGGRNG